MTYEQFKTKLHATLYKTTGHIASAPNACSTWYDEMFRVVGKTQALIILQFCEEFEEFHPDSIALHKQLITKYDKTINGGK